MVGFLHVAVWPKRMSLVAYLFVFVASHVAVIMTAHSKLDTTQVIKASIAFRAKYRMDQSASTPTITRYAPALVVPHPKNRGGVPVKSIRTMQLSGDLVRDGFDPIEADSNAVAVEQNPKSPGW